MDWLVVDDGESFCDCEVQAAKCEELVGFAVV
jgi:hypothetical protein